MSDRIASGGPTSAAMAGCWWLSHSPGRGRARWLWPTLSSVRLVGEPDRRDPAAMGRTHQLAIDLPHADPDAPVGRQVARHHHRHAPAGVVGDYGIGESGIEHRFPSRPDEP